MMTKRMKSTMWKIIVLATLLVIIPIGYYHVWYFLTDADVLYLCVWFTITAAPIEAGLLFGLTDTIKKMRRLVKRRRYYDR